MSNFPTISHLENALKLLGTTSDEVVSKLEIWGFKGVPSSVVECPLARYLSQELSVPVMVGINCASFDNYKTSCYLPSAVKKFRRGFDTGRFPSLNESKF